MMNLTLSVLVSVAGVSAAAATPADHQENQFVTVSTVASSFGRVKTLFRCSGVTHVKAVLLRGGGLSLCI